MDCDFEKLQFLDLEGASRDELEVLIRIQRSHYSAVEMPDDETSPVDILCEPLQPTSELQVYGSCRMPPEGIEECPSEPVACLVSVEPPPPPPVLTPTALASMPAGPSFTHPAAFPVQPPMVPPPPQPYYYAYHHHPLHMPQYYAPPAGSAAAAYHQPSLAEHDQRRRPARKSYDLKSPTSPSVYPTMTAQAATGPPIILPPSYPGPPHHHHPHPYQQHYQQIYIYPTPNYPPVTATQELAPSPNLSMPPPSVHGVSVSSPPTDISRGVHYEPYGQETTAPVDVSTAGVLSPLNYSPSPNPVSPSQHLHIVSTSPNMTGSLQHLHLNSPSPNMANPSHNPLIVSPSPDTVSPSPPPDTVSLSCPSPLLDDTVCPSSPLDATGPLLPSAPYAGSDSQSRQLSFGFQLDPPSGINSAVQILSPDPRQQRLKDPDPAAVRSLSPALCAWTDAVQILPSAHQPEFDPPTKTGGVNVQFVSEHTSDRGTPLSGANSPSPVALAVSARTDWEDSVVHVDGGASSTCFQLDVRARAAADDRAAPVLKQQRSTVQANDSNRAVPALKQQSSQQQGSTAQTIDSKMSEVVERVHEKPKSRPLTNGCAKSPPPSLLNGAPTLPSSAASPTPSTVPAPAGKSWASLFRGNGPAVNRSVTPPPPPKPRPPPPPTNTANTRLTSIAETLVGYELCHKTLRLKPRGLTNKSNWCYINATLQALVSCAPFYHLMKSLPPPPVIPSTAPPSTEKSRTPIIDALVRLVGEFSCMRDVPHVTRRERQQLRDVPCDPAFQPDYVYAVLADVSSDAFRVAGRQEDAEEFLTCVLSGLQDEMHMLLTRSDDVNGDQQPVPQHDDDDDTDPDDWQIIGKNNKGQVTRSAELQTTPISRIFAGQLRSSLHRNGSKTTATIQSFFSLQLDIQSEQVSSVDEAMLALSSRDPVEGLNCPLTGQPVEAWQQVTLEQTPPTLILHLKRFLFDPTADAVQKLHKRIHFSVELELKKELLSSGVRSQRAASRRYRLFAVVCHGGRQSSKGHYIADCYQPAHQQWLRYDDSCVTSVSEQSVLRPEPPLVPYILFYRRLDTAAQHVNGAHAQSHH